MAQQAMIVFLALTLALDIAPGRIGRAIFGLLAAVTAIHMAESAIIALPGFLVRHVYG